MDESRAKIKVLEEQLNQANVVSKGKLAHIVFLDIKDGLQKHQIDSLSKAIEALDNIEFIDAIHKGKIADTGDSRFISDHELMFQITVDNQEEMDAYQKHPIHLELKRVAGKYLSKAPAVYDYWVE